MNIVPKINLGCHYYITLVLCCKLFVYRFRLPRKCLKIRRFRLQPIPTLIPTLTRKIDTDSDSRTDSAALIHAYTRTRTRAHTRRRTRARPHARTRAFIYIRACRSWSSDHPPDGYHHSSSGAPSSGHQAAAAAAVYRLYTLHKSKPRKFNILRYIPPLN